MEHTSDFVESKEKTRYITVYFFDIHIPAIMENQFFEDFSELRQYFLNPRKLWIFVDFTLQRFLGTF